MNRTEIQMRPLSAAKTTILLGFLFLAIRPATSIAASPSTVNAPGIDIGFDSGFDSALERTHPLRWTDPVSGEVLSGPAVRIPTESDAGTGPAERSRTAPEPATGSLTVSQVAELPRALFQSIVFGDTDHDSRNEAIFYNGSNGDFHFRVLEEQGGNLYEEVYAGASLIPYAVADLDGDGKAEVIGQDGYHVYVYESPDASGHPSELAWASPPLENIVGLTAIGDTDRDGKMEIIHSRNPWSSETSLLIWENDGDDSFTLVFEAPTGEGDKGQKLIADLDQDGLVEIVLSGSNGDLHVFESDADDSWAETFSVQTDLFSAFACKGGIDTDGNGKPEIFLQGSRIEGWTTYVYEASGNDQYEIVATLIEDDGYIGLSGNVLAKLTPGGPTYYVSDIAEWLSVYEPVAPGDWQKVLEVPDPDGTWHHGIFAFDVNGNGHDELFWGTSGEFDSIVLESPADPSAIGNAGGDAGDGRLDPPGAMATLRVFPNPIRRGEGRLEWGTFGTEPSARSGNRLNITGGRLDVADVEGRVVRTEVLDRFPGRWSADGLPAGRYYLRLRDPSGLEATGSVLVVH